MVDLSRGARAVLFTREGLSALRRVCGGGGGFCDVFLSTTQLNSYKC